MATLDISRSQSLETGLIVSTLQLKKSVCFLWWALFGWCAARGMEEEGGPAYWAGSVLLLPSSSRGS